jgi:hypothetical protein
MGGSGVLVRLDDSMIALLEVVVILFQAVAIKAAASSRIHTTSSRAIMDLSSGSSTPGIVQWQQHTWHHRVCDAGACLLCCKPKKGKHGNAQVEHMRGVVAAEVCVVCVLQVASGWRWTSSACTGSH